MGRLFYVTVRKNNFFQKKVDLVLILGHFGRKIVKKYFRSIYWFYFRNFGMNGKFENIQA
jgi:hypothetical protein